MGVLMLFSLLPVPPPSYRCAHFAFLRYTETQTILVILNYSNKHRTLAFDVKGKQTASVLFSTVLNKNDGNLTGLHLARFEVLIAELK